MAADSTSIRGKDWVFNAFWAATLALRTADVQVAPCTLNIPVTVVFKSGRPTKTLRTSAGGKVEKVNLDEITDERFESEKGFRGTSFKGLRALRRLLIEFSDKHGYALAQSSQNDEPFICKVRQ